MISSSLSTRRPARTFPSAAASPNGPTSLTRNRWRDESDARGVLHEVRRPETRGGAETHLGRWRGTRPNHRSRRQPAGPHDPVWRLSSSDGPADLGQRKSRRCGESGRLHAPQKTGIAYMLATDEVWHDQSSNNIARHVYPHIMVYAPYLTNSDIAVAPEQVWRPDRVCGQYEGRPDAYLIFEVGSSWTKP